ncbi:LytR C-terminal domain-containing protein [Janthinobacterium sp. Ant5-2-1]|uniref:LytR C-terminal domain-containing protein n=1 Tax=Janthinobacterium sp. Ant5-2-1 TaxID=1755239 RepID=UPI0007180DAF|nr:LytR C-terminal domain-containing protein [Janthinobacterium sp. Ant5-2-1]
MRLTISRLATACACLGLGACASHTAHAPSFADADAAYVAGRQHFDAGDLPAAQAAYEQALRAAPRHLNARNGLAVLHAQRGEHGAAIAHWLALTQEAGTPQPRQAYLFSNLGHAYYLSGRDAQALTALEQACLLDPLNALAWRHLAQVLERLGQHARAAVMRRQTASLQEHDVRRDMALLRGETSPKVVSVPAPVPDARAMARVEITQSDGMARLRRVPAAERSLPVSASVPAAPVAGAPHPRLEIVNGNGVPGLAAALARSLAGAPVQVVRLANETSFQVARTRVEYRPAQEQAARQLARQLGAQARTQVQIQAADCPASELRLVLGRDLSDPAMLHRYYLQQLQLARRALARLG